ncbi:MAG: hypothetical protein AB7G75_13555 [Candidatus Binatia bacterium]
MLLNDVRNEQQRLACLLAGHVELHRAPSYRAGALVGIFFTVATMLVLGWYSLQVLLRTPLQ